MPHPGHEFVDLLGLGLALLDFVTLLEHEIEVAHGLVHHFDVVEVAHLRHQLLLQILLVKVLRLLMTHLILHLEYALGEQVLKVTEALLTGHFEQVARDVAVLPRVAEEVHALRGLVNLKLTHRGQLLTSERRLLSLIDHV